VKQHRRMIRCLPAEQRFTVLRIDGDPKDTHAARSFEAALRLAQPDRGSTVEVFRTCARDPGAARLQRLQANMLVRQFRKK